VARSSLTIEQVLTLLAETPARIAALTTGLTPAQLRTAPSRGEWSLNDVLAHLRSCADARGEFTRAILAEDRPTLRAIDPTTWIEKTDYPELEFGPSFRSFTRQRARLLTFLKSVPKESWSRTAIVTGGGPARERTVLFYAQWLARHERAHVKHVGRIVNTMRLEKRPARRSN
jgi:DinB family protein